VDATRHCGGADSVVFLVNLLSGLSLTAPYQQTVAWLATPINSVCIVAWIIAVFYHAALGLQVVIEDYVAAEGPKIISIWAVNLAFLFLAIAALLAVFRIVSIG
jgi:succinate dehydrogenase / fumarate reductase membrane anchor subunit